MNVWNLAGQQNKWNALLRDQLACLFVWVCLHDDYVRANVSHFLPAATTSLGLSDWWLSFVQRTTDSIRHNFKAWLQVW